MGISRLGARVWVAIAVTMTVAVAGCRAGEPPHVAAPATASVAAPQQEPLPCQKVSIDFQPKLQDQHIRCVLRIDAELTLDVSTDLPWSFTLRNAGGVAQEFREPTETIGESGVAPVLQDIDSSGTAALLVITGQGGTGGEPMAVWRMTGQPPRFVRAGEVFGFRRFYQTPEGFFGNYAHGSAVSGGVQLYRWVDDKLATVALLDLRAAAAGPEPFVQHDWVRNANVLCRLYTDDYPAGAQAKQAAALQAVGIDPAIAQEHFCTQPWVASIYR